MTATSPQRFFIAGALGALLAGCSGNQNSSLSQVLPAATGTSAVGDSSTRQVVYISDINGPNFAGQVHVYPASLHSTNPPQIRTITNGTQRPDGIWVDSAGTLYVTNIPDGAQTTGVSEYHPGASVPFRVLTDGLIFPTAVAVAADGTVYVNQRLGSRSRTGDFVTIYPPGHTHHSKTITVHNGGYDSQANQLTFDTQGNLLVAFDLPIIGGPHVFSVSPTTLKVTEIPFNLAGLDATGIAVDGAGNTYISGSASIGVFPPNSMNPSRMIGRGAQHLTALADGTLYAATGSGVDEYKPGASSPFNSITAQGVVGFGIAVGPAR
jgi:hypothetical protein